jgi:hypothetical protein
VTERLIRPKCSFNAGFISIGTLEAVSQWRECKWLRRDVDCIVSTGFIDFIDSAISIGSVDPTAFMHSTISIGSIGSIGSIDFTGFMVSVVAVVFNGLISSIGSIEYWE